MLAAPASAPTVCGRAGLGQGTRFNRGNDAMRNRFARTHEQGRQQHSHDPHQRFHAIEALEVRRMFAAYAAIGFGGIDSDDDDSAQGVATDAAGNVYVSGTFSGTADFQPGSGRTLLTSESSLDNFVAKYTPQGRLVWARRFGGADDLQDQAQQGTAGRLAVDSKGNVYVTGYFESTRDFDPGSGFAILDADAQFSGFVLKLDARGRFQWARTIGIDGGSTGTAIAVDEEDAVYVTGFYDEDLEIPIAGNRVVDLNNEGSRDIFVARLTPAGEFTWARGIGDKGSDVGLGIAARNGAVYVSGSFESEVDFDPDPRRGSVLNGTDVDGFVLKLTAADGKFTWARDFTGDGLETASSLAIAPSGDVWVTGLFNSDNFDLDPGRNQRLATTNGKSDVWLTKLSSAGRFLVGHAMGGRGFDGGADITTDAGGNVYLTGFYSGSFDAAPGARTFRLATAQTRNFNAFVEKLTSAGTFVWARAAGGQDDTFGAGIAVGAGRVYVSGSYFKSADFNPGAGKKTLTSNGERDGYLFLLTSDKGLLA